MKKVILCILALAMTYFCGCSSNSLENAPLYDHLTKEQRRIIALRLSEKPNHLEGSYGFERDNIALGKTAEDYEVQITDSDEEINEVWMEPMSLYSAMRLFTHVQKGHGIAMDEVRYRGYYGKLTYIKRNEQGGLYSVNTTEEGGYVYIFFAEDPELPKKAPKMTDVFYVEKKLNYKDFSSIKKGSTFEDVKNIDATAQLYENLYYSRQRTYLYTGEDLKKPWKSHHYTADGIIRFQYELKGGKWKVAEIIKDGFVSKTSAQSLTTDAHILDMDWPPLSKDNS